MRGALSHRGALAVGNLSTILLLHTHDLLTWPSVANRKNAPNKTRCHVARSETSELGLVSPLASIAALPAAMPALSSCSEWRAGCEVNWMTCLSEFQTDAPTTNQEHLEEKNLLNSAPPLFHSTMQHKPEEARLGAKVSHSKTKTHPQQALRDVGALYPQRFVLTP